MLSTVKTSSLGLENFVCLFMRHLCNKTKKEIKFIRQHFFLFHPKHRITMVIYQCLVESPEVPVANYKHINKFKNY